VAWNADDWTFEALAAHYHTLVRYLQLNDMGMVLGYGCGTPSMTRASSYMNEAYQLGRSLLPPSRRPGQSWRDTCLKETHNLPKTHLE
jgi:hypothetical protein